MKKKAVRLIRGGYAKVVSPLKDGVRHPQGDMVKIHVGNWGKIEWIVQGSCGFRVFDESIRGFSFYTIRVPRENVMAINKPPTTNLRRDRGNKATV